MGLYGKGNLFEDKRDNTKGYKSMELYGKEEKSFENKIGVFDRGDGLFSKLGVFDRVNKFVIDQDRSRRKQKLEKVLKEIVNEVNIVPRGFGSLPENKNISMNGYFNYKHPEIMDSGNDHEINVRLYAQAMQLIDDLFYDCRHLYKGDPEFEAMAEKVRTNLEKREGYENSLRAKGYQEEIAREARALDEKFGAITPDPGYKEMAKSGINGVLSRAEKKYIKQVENEWGELLSTKRKKQLSETMEKLKMCLMRQNLYFVPREEIRKYRNRQELDSYFENKSQQKAKINDVLSRAEKELREPLNTKEKEQLSKTMEKLKVYLIHEEDVQLVPRDEILNFRRNAPERRPFEERMQKFIEKYTPTREDSPTKGTLESSRESLDMFTRRALAEDKLAKETGKAKDAKQILTPPRDVGERC